MSGATAARPEPETQQSRAAPARRRASRRRAEPRAVAGPVRHGHGATLAAVRARPAGRAAGRRATAGPGGGGRPGGTDGDSAVTVSGSCRDSEPRGGSGVAVAAVRSCCGCCCVDSAIRVRPTGVRGAHTVRGAHGRTDAHWRARAQAGTGAHAQPKRHPSHLL